MYNKIIDYYSMYLNGEMNLAQAYAEALNQRAKVKLFFEDHFDDGSLQRASDIVDILTHCITQRFLDDNGYYFDLAVGWRYEANSVEYEEAETAYFDSLENVHLGDELPCDEENEQKADDEDLPF